MSDTTSLGSPIPIARKVSPLRQRMIDDMTVCNLALNTRLCYLKQASYLARYFGRSPDQLGLEDIRRYLIYLSKERKVSVSSRIGGGHCATVFLRRHFETGPGHRNDSDSQARNTVCR